MTFEQLCDMLPADVMWGQPITPDIVREIVTTADRAAREECARICEFRAEIHDIAGISMEAQCCADAIRETI